MLSEKTIRIVKEITPLVAANAETITRIYFCGPKPFMRNVHASLKELGVDQHRVRYEFFGPKEDLVAASV